MGCDSVSCVVIGVVLLLAVDTNGWGPFGHRAVARIAYKMVRPTTMKAVDAYLSEFAPGQTLWDISTWPDDYSHSPEGAWSAPQHYVNFPDDATGPVMARDCPNLCVISAIANYSTRLVSPEVSPSEKFLALKWLVHYVADIHCPVHCGYAADRGGNDINVRIYGVVRNLHYVWDTAIIVRSVSDDVELADAILSDLTPAAIRAYESISAPEDMARDTFLTAKISAYNLPPSHDLGRCYTETNFHVMKRLLGMASIRLVVLLDRLLG